MREGVVTDDVSGRDDLPDDVGSLADVAADQEEGLDVDRLSFTHALCVLKRYLPDFQRADPEDWPWLQKRMQRELRDQRLPERRLRTNPPS